jgi:hypothetical protein
MLTAQAKPERRATWCKPNQTPLTKRRLSPALGMLEGDSFYVSTLESVSPKTQIIEKLTKLQSAPISDA